MILRTCFVLLCLALAGTVSAQKSALTSPAKHRCDSLEAENQILRETLQHFQDQLIESRTEIIRLQRELDGESTGTMGMATADLSPDDVAATMVIDFPGRRLVREASIPDGQYEEGVLILTLYVTRSGTVQSTKREQSRSTVTSEKQWLVAEEVAMDLMFNGSASSAPASRATLTVVFGE